MESGKRKIVVIGASRGIGAAVAQHFAQKGDSVFSISRGQPIAGEWIQADISTPEGIKSIVSSISESTVDALLFMGGVWENGAFTKQYDFMKSPDEETRFVIAVNTVAPIEITKQLARNLAKSNNPRAIFIGALSGLDNSPTIEVANTASKFGLRGAAQSLRLALRDYKIGITVINPGNIATEEVIADIEESRFKRQIPISLKDFISAIEWILSLSNTVDISEINMYQKG
ncbi:NAD(P)-dependent oxidoreductase [Fischerella muscicola CCMEE 5323]|uniref:NAD(P)-dependent oxidoreductase n=2 Tax=Hapalosiphonaceae TaxID=1892263 RepID=A0A2N6K934_FISMU|nr:SDR family oxidoreductase [Fischerella muscicola]MBD2434880.1 SDR family oxidoreductase [Fischerella sp. FACHB-380]PLZ94475.1 NAD(P)-dependent oxidoreductase [Fischerella muscicola CCMEE 5323]